MEIITNENGTEVEVYGRNEYPKHDDKKTRFIASEMPDGYFAIVRFGRYEDRFVIDGPNKEQIINACAVLNELD